MADPCCDTYGGLITIEGGGVRFQVRGEVTIEPTARMVDGEAHQDGSGYFVEKPKLYVAEFDFSAGCDASKWAVLTQCAVNITVTVENSGRTTQHLFTGGRFTGQPRLNLSTGLVTGSQYKSAKYRAV